MKKLVSLILVLAVLCSGNVFAAASFVPARETFERAGLTVNWVEQDSKQQMRLEKGEMEILITIGDDTITTHNRNYIISGNPYISKEGKAFVPEDTLHLVTNLIKYDNAVIDAMDPREDELRQLFFFDKSESEVLVGVWHKYPESYTEGETVTVDWGDVFVVSAVELTVWAIDNMPLENPVERFEQLIGLPPQKGYTHYTFMWVNPSDLFRPAPDNRVDSPKTSLEYPPNTTAEYKRWFENNLDYSYTDHLYPFTGMGYTYDWLKDKHPYGLSEFVLKKGSKATVEMTLTNDELFEYLTDRADETLRPAA